MDRLIAWARRSQVLGTLLVMFLKEIIEYDLAF